MTALRSTLLALLVLSTLLAPGSRAAAQELSHDDGRREAQKSMAGAGHAIRFERPGDELYVTAVRVLGSRYGGGYDPDLTFGRVRVMDGTMKVLAEAWVAYSSWKVGAFDWVEVPIGPCAVPESFLVGIELFPERTKGVYVGVDQDSSGNSFSFSAGGASRAFEEGEWMIRAVGTKKRPEVELPDLADTEVAAHGSDEDGAVDQRSTAGAGHAVRFKASSKHRFLTRISLFGARYGGGYDPESTLFHVFVCDKKLNVLAHSAHPYATFPTGDLRWVDVDVPPVVVPREFYVLVHFDPTQTKGVYVGRWKEKGGYSLSANPGGRGTKLDGGLGWMMRATMAGSLGEQPLPEAAEEGGDGLDAAQLAEIAGELDEAEAEEDVARLEARIDEVSATDPAAAAGLGRFQESAHFLLRRVGLTEEEGARVLALMESAHRSIERRFGVARVSAVPDKKVHVHVIVDEDADTKLFTSPSGERFSLIVYRGPRGSLRSPAHGGRPNVYGLCHELGHVLTGWEDDRHQWAHYVGSLVVDDVVAELGEDAWLDPYDARPEGTARLLSEIEGVAPGRDTDAGVARLFHDLGERLGTEAYGPALAWIRANREGEPFEAVRLYRLDDLRDALLAGGTDRGVVIELLGD